MSDFDDLAEIYEELGNADAVFSLAAGGTIGPVRGVFDSSYVDISIGVAGVESSNPVFTCAFESVAGAAGLCAVQEEDTVRIGATQYIVRNPRPDGEGSVTFDLQEKI